MAPEVNARKPYHSHTADIFSLGVILFSMYSGHPPFERAIDTDRHFKYIMQGRIDTFWKKHEKFHEEGFYTPEFK